MMKIPLTRKSLNVDQLLLDPNNPRFFDDAGWEEVQINIYHLPSVQNKAFKHIEGTQNIGDLKQSILYNGFIGSESLVVKPYDDSDQHYVVIEGNRRLAAIRSIIDNAQNPAADEIVELGRLEVLVYEGTGEDDRDLVNMMVLQGLRHIGGPREWGAYQKANLIVQLRDQHNINWADIGQRIALGPIVTSRYYRAFMALRQMMEDEEFRTYAHPKLFSLFDEALKKNVIKQWMGWNDDNHRFENSACLSAFYQLIVGDPESEHPSPRITNPGNMRDFSKLLNSAKTSVINRFLNGELDVNEAVRIAVPDTTTVTLRDGLDAFMEMLTGFPVDRLTDISADEINLLCQVKDKIDSLVDLRGMVVEKQK